MVFSALCLSALMVRANGDSSFTVHSYESTDCTGDATTTSETLAQISVRVGLIGSNNCYVSGPTPCCSSGASQNDAAVDCQLQQFDSTDCTGTASGYNDYQPIPCVELSSSSFEIPTCASVTPSSSTGGGTNSNTNTNTNTNSNPSPSPTPTTGGNSNTNTNSNPSPSPTPTINYECGTSGAGSRTMRISSLDQGAPFNDCICIGDWNTKDINDEIRVVDRLDTGCCPLGTVPGVQMTTVYHGAQVVCGFTADGSLDISLNTAAGCDYKTCYVHKQNLPCADGTNQRLNGCCAGSPSGSGDVTVAERKAFATDASCSSYTAEIFTAISLLDYFEYCTTYHSDYSALGDVGTIATADDIRGDQAGFNVDNYRAFQPCAGGNPDAVDDSGAEMAGMPFVIFGLLASMAF